MFRQVFEVVLLLLVAMPLETSARDVDLADQVTRFQDSEVWIAYAAGDGVCGDGQTYISTDGGSRHFHGCWSSELDPDDCVAGPVRVALKVRDGEVVKVATFVGGDWGSPGLDTLDLGEIPAQAAADYLLSLASRGSRQVAEQAILPATLARDVVVWPQLLELARDNSRPRNVREASLFWLSQIAGEKVTQNLEQMVEDDDEDLELRKHAIFALTQRGDEVCVPVLSRIVLTSQHPQLRESALFWLAQSEDPRVLELFERILLED